jgi:hypothetical protein
VAAGATSPADVNIPAPAVEDELGGVHFKPVPRYAIMGADLDPGVDEEEGSCEGSGSAAADAVR